MVKNLPATAGDATDAGSICGSGRAPGEGNGNPLQDSCLEKSHGQRSLVGYSPWGCRSWTQLSDYTTAIIEISCAYICMCTQKHAYTLHTHTPTHTPTHTHIIRMYPFYFMIESFKLKYPNIFPLQILSAFLGQV